MRTITEICTGTACGTVFAAAVTSCVFGVTAIQWWDPPTWVASSAISAVIGMRYFRRRDARAHSWLDESASWPEPWSRHDLDGEEMKADAGISEIARLYAAAFTERRGMHPGMFG